MHLQIHSSISLSVIDSGSLGYLDETYQKLSFLPDSNIFYVVHFYWTAAKPGVNRNSC